MMGSFSYCGIVVYGFNVNGVERWRAPPPAWPELSKLPMSQETVDLFETDTTIEVWSRAGGCLRLSKTNGSQIGIGHFELEGSLSNVYGTSSSRCCCSMMDDVASIMVRKGS